MEERAWNDISLRLQDYARRLQQHLASGTAEHWYSKGQLYVRLFELAISATYAVQRASLMERRPERKAADVKLEAGSLPYASIADLRAYLQSLEHALSGLQGKGKQFVWPGFYFSAACFRIASMVDALAKLRRQKPKTVFASDWEHIQPILEERDLVAHQVPRQSRKVGYVQLVDALGIVIAEFERDLAGTRQPGRQGCRRSDPAT